MEACNECSKLVAKAIETLKGYIQAVNEHDGWEIVPVQDSVKMLEVALDKLVAEM